MDYTEFEIKKEFEGFKVVQYKEDEGLKYCEPQNCYTNSYWVNIDNESILMSFYSKDKDRIQGNVIYDMANDLKAEDYRKIIKDCPTPAFNVCWDDFVPVVSMVWRYYTVLKH